MNKVHIIDDNKLVIDAIVNCLKNEFISKNVLGKFEDYFSFIHIDDIEIEALKQIDFPDVDWLFIDYTFFNLEYHSDEVFYDGEPVKADVLLDRLVEKKKSKLNVVIYTLNHAEDVNKTNLLKEKFGDKFGSFRVLNNAKAFNLFDSSFSSAQNSKVSLGKNSDYTLYGAYLANIIAPAIFGTKNKYLDQIDLNQDIGFLNEAIDPILNSLEMVGFKLGLLSWSDDSKFYIDFPLKPYYEKYDAIIERLQLFKNIKGDSEEYVYLLNYNVSEKHLKIKDIEFVDISKQITYYLNQNNTNNKTPLSDPRKNNLESFTPFLHSAIFYEPEYFLEKDYEKNQKLNYKNSIAKFDDGKSLPVTIIYMFKKFQPYKDKYNGELHAAFYLKQHVTGLNTKEIYSKLFHLIELYGEGNIAIHYKKELYKKAQLTQKAAIMGRNMSHNIGSHVLYYLKTSLSDYEKIISHKVIHDFIAFDENGAVIINTDEKRRKNIPFLFGLGKFINYLQERQDFIATISTDYIPSFATLSFKENIFDEINYDLAILRHKGSVNESTKNNIILDYIARSENYSRNKIQIAFKKYLGIEQKDATLGWSLDETETNEIEELKKEMRKLDVALPGGTMGRQALFSIIENIIRNACKHSKAQNIMRITFDYLDLKDSEAIEEILKENKQSDFISFLNRLKLDPELSDSIDEFYLFSIFDNVENDIAIIDKLKQNLKDPLIKSELDLSGSNDFKGLKEIKISASWLIGREYEDDPINLFIDAKDAGNGRYNIRFNFLVKKSKSLLYIDIDNEVQLNALKSKREKLEKNKKSFDLFDIVVAKAKDYNENLEKELFQYSGRVAIVNDKELNSLSLTGGSELNEDQKLGLEHLGYKKIIEKAYKDHYKSIEFIIEGDVVNNNKVSNIITLGNSGKTLVLLARNHTDTLPQLYGGKETEESDYKPGLKDLYNMYGIELLNIPAQDQLKVLPKNINDALNNEYYLLNEEGSKEIVKVYDNKSSGGYCKIDRRTEVEFIEVITGHNSTKSWYTDEYEEQFVNAGDKRKSELYLFKNIDAALKLVTIIDERLFEQAICFPVISTMKELYIFFENIVKVRYESFEKIEDSNFSPEDIISIWCKFKEIDDNEFYNAYSYNPDIIPNFIKHYNENEFNNSAFLKCLIFLDLLFEYKLTSSPLKKIDKYLGIENKSREGILIDNIILEAKKRFSHKPYFLPMKNVHLMDIDRMTGAIIDRNLQVLGQTHKKMEDDITVCYDLSFTTESLPNIMSIHQGLLDKFKFENSPNKELEKIKVHNYKIKVIPDNENPPKIIIHSGRSKPNNLPSPAKFVTFSQLEQAVFDKKKSLVDILLKAN